MADTKIEWAEKSWNPVTGCTPVSAGCQNCYARRMASRLRGRYVYPADDPFKVTLHPDKLDEPLHWRKPRRVFVCSMGDLFHDDVHRDNILDVWDVMARAPQHTFLVLTKRPERMQRLVAEWLDHAMTLCLIPHTWPLPNVHLGVSIENQQTADERIPLLLQTPAAVRFVSAEPLLGPVDFNDVPAVPTVEDFDKCVWRLGQIICGAETGPGARPMDLDWARSVRDQCAEAGVAYFFKRDSAGNRKLDGKLHEEYPE